MLSSSHADPFSPSAPAAAERYEPTERDKDEAARLRDLFERSYASRNIHDTDWNFYLGYLEGDQNWYVNSQTGRAVQVLDATKRRRHSMFNVLKPTARSLRGKMARSVPTFTVRPGTGSQDEIYGARVGDRLIEWFWDKERVLEKYKECLGDLAWAGIGILYLHWDPFSGEELGHCPKCQLTLPEPWHVLPGVPTHDIPCPQCQEPLLRIFEGDVKVRRVDPRQFFVQPGCDRFDDMEYCFTREAYPVSLLRKWYPQFSAFIKSEGDVYPSSGYHQAYNIQARSYTSEELNDHAFLVRFYEKSSGLFPNGRVVHLINGQIVYEAEAAYPMLRLPFYPVRWETTAGSFFPTPPMSDAWHRQKELNELETVFREHAELVVRPKIIIPWGTKIAADEVTAVTGQVLMPTPQYANTIKFLPMPELPAFMIQRREQLISDIRLIFGVTVAEVNAPTDGSGRTLAIQQAESDQSIGHIISAAHEQLACLTQDMLAMYKCLASPKRKFAIMGDDALEVYDFQALNWQRGWQVSMETDDGLSKNRALRLQEVMNLASAGFFGDIKAGKFDPSLAAKAAKLKIPGLGPNQSDSEYIAVQAVIREMLEGQLYTPQDEDDANKFIEGLMNWLRTKGRILGKEDPTTVTQIRQLLRFYVQKVVESQMAQAPGAPPAPGASGSPPGADQTAPGGSPNAPTDTGGGDSAQNDAQAHIKSADKAGETQAGNAAGPR
jgi:hypothetical protein